MGCADATQRGDAERGKQIYDAPIKAERGELQPCSKCHPVGAGEKPATGIGMNLGDIGNRAGTTVPGQSAEDYLRTSIVDPDAHLAGGFQDGLMSRDYKKLLTPQQVEDLVAYMLTLKK
jgi:cytochrome c2